MKEFHTIRHDGASHHPLGAGSYVFRKNLIAHILQYCTRPRVILRIGAQPNNSPHMGTLVTFAVAFALAKAIREHRDDDRFPSPPRDVLISLDLVDTAPSEKYFADGIDYQRSQRHTHEMDRYMADYNKVVDMLHGYSGVPWRIRTQAEVLNHPAIPPTIRAVVHPERREELARAFAPETGKLAMRAACPRDGCGLADKHGIRNVYDDVAGKITFFCPEHGAHIIDLASPTDVARLEFNTPLRNYIRTVAFGQDMEASWIQVTGGDYAGYYQEQLLWRHLRSGPAPLIFYSPTIVDWSGAKLSKSLYVKQDAYQYLEEDGLDYMVSFDQFTCQGKNLRVIYEEVTDWVENPRKLFRSYSIAYIDQRFKLAAAAATISEK